LTDADSDMDQSQSERSSLWTALGRFPPRSVFIDRLGPAHQGVGGMILYHDIVITNIAGQK